MTLREFLKSTGMRQSDFAERIGRSASYVSMVASGQIWPSRDAVLAIQRATDGQVTPNDLLTEEPAPPQEDAAA